jgi:hypothetical protein
MKRSGQDPITPATTAAPATAAGQALGFSLQFTRLTAMLLEAPPGSFCSLEVLDDTAAEHPDGTAHLGQSKSTLGDNPVADRATSLWKTFYNWSQLVQKGLICPEKTSFELYVSRKVGGAIVEAFHGAKDAKQAKCALDAARAELWGAAPHYPSKKGLSPGLARYVNPVFGAPETQILAIIANFLLRCGSGSPQADLESLLSQHPISESRRGDVRDKLLGWVKHQVDTRLEKELPAVISRDEFHKEYTAYVRWADRETILKSFAPKPTYQQQLAHMSAVFVRQLDLIGLDFDSKLEAVSDFLRAVADRTYWSKAGHVHEEVFEVLDDDLQRVWKNICRQKLLEHREKTPTEQGSAIHACCMLHQAQVQGMTPPGHFVPGCFHRLADELEVGWHPSYRGELKRQPETSTA